MIENIFFIHYTWSLERERERERDLLGAKHNEHRLSRMGPH